MNDDKATHASGPPPSPRSSGHDDTIPASSPPEAAIADEAAPSGERYRLGAELGRGGMGRVVEAFDTQLGRTVALKEVLPKAAAGAARRFVREVQITARLEHASIVPLYDSGTTVDGRPYYVMRKVTGRPLEELIARAPALRDRLALLQNLLSAIDAVAHAHRRGVIHRDLKPANILVGELGETVVIDWGLAKVIGEEDPTDDPLEPRVPAAADSLQTQIGSVFGTPGFMPPEQARGEELGPRGDVFALGATLYTLLVGKPPVGGKSATEMIEATHKHAIVPVAQAAPGTPPELVAIVDKSLAFEAQGRYANAGALGEDLRRFLTGQVVAAHHYSRRERLARFARRNRAVLSVSAIGVAIVAVLAWVGVHRIVAERDAATAAKAEALSEKQQLDVANHQLADQLDAILVTQARSLVAINPTKAIAILKKVRPTYGKPDDVRVVAQQAVTRGVAWALPTGGGPTFWHELDQTGTRIVEATMPGDVRVFDLEGRRLGLTRTYRRGVRASWLDDGKSLLVYGPGAPAQIIDPRDGTAKPDALPVMEWGLLDEHGTRIIYVDAQRAAGVYDFAKHEARAIPVTDVRDLAMATDASWYAVVDRKQIVVYDKAGAAIARRAVGASTVVAAGKRKLATLDDLDVQELVLDPAPHWVPQHVPVEGGGRTMQLLYRGDQLVANTTSSGFLLQAKDTFVRVTGDPGLSWDLVAAGEVVAAIGSDGKIHYQMGYAIGELVLPMPVPSPRLVGRPGVSRFVVAGEGVLVVYDFADLLPRRATLQHGGQTAFADDDLALVHDQTPEWSWYDLAADKVIPLEGAWGENYLLDIDGERRALVTANDAAGNHLSIVKPGQPPHELRKSPMTPAMRAKFPPRAGALIPGDAVAFGEGASVYTATGSEEAREVVKVDGEVVAITRLGRLRYAALSVRGELARGNVGGGDVERAHVDLHGTALLAPDRLGRALVATGKQLFVWDTSLRELAHFAQPVVWMAAADGGIAVELADRQVLVVASDGTSRRVMTVGNQPPSLSRDGQLMVGSGNGSQIEIVELPSGASWSMTVPWASSDETPSLSPSTRRMAFTAGSLLLWTLPEPKGQLQDWLGDLTSACLAGDVLAWPWESKCRP